MSVQHVTGPAAAPADAASALQRYREDGYVVLPSLLTADELQALRAQMDPLLDAAPRGRNDFEGFQSNRVYALLAKAPAIAVLVEHPRVLELLDAVLSPGYLLSANLAINLLPGETAQNWHVDDGFYPIARPRPEISVGVIWSIDEFTADNGATEVIPGSHRWVDEQPDLDDARRVLAVMPAGSAIVFAGTLWHRGGANHSAARRLAISPQYCQPWARQQENMMAAVGSAAANYSARIQSLLGYSIHPPFMGHIDGMHPLRLLDPQYRSADHGFAQRAADYLDGRIGSQLARTADA